MIIMVKTNFVDALALSFFFSQDENDSGGWGLLSSAFG